VKQALSAEVEKRIELLFAPEEQAEARSMLVDVDWPESCWSAANPDRVRFGVLKLSHGRLQELRDAVKLANLDFRDALMAAGFGDPESYRRWIPGRKR
jgi:hypothetical protein